MNSLDKISTTQVCLYSGLAFSSSLVAHFMRKNLKMKPWQQETLSFLWSFLPPSLFLASGRSLKTVIRLNGISQEIFSVLALLVHARGLFTSNDQGEQRRSRFSIGKSFFSASIQSVIIWQINKRFRIASNNLLIPFSFFSKMMADLAAHVITPRQKRQAGDIDDDEFFEGTSDIYQFPLSSLSLYAITRSHDAVVMNCALSQTAMYISRILEKMIFPS